MTTICPLRRSSSPPLALIALLLSASCIHGFANHNLIPSSHRYNSPLGSTAAEEDSLVSPGSSKREITASAKVILPFAATTAFDAFADLPRQPSWSPWLHDVRYIDGADAEDDGSDAGVVIPLRNTNPIDGADAEDDGSDAGVVIPLRNTKWTMGYKGFKYSWCAVSTNLERPSIIEWQSTSGLRNYGSVRFDERVLDEERVETEMVLAMRFRAPRVIAALFRRSSAIKAVMETMLGGTLEGFRDVVMKEDLDLSPLGSLGPRLGPSRMRDKKADSR